MDKALEAMFEEIETADGFGFALVGEPFMEFTPRELQLHKSVLELRKFVEAYDKLEKYREDVEGRSEALGHELATMQNVSPDSPAANKLRGKLDSLHEVRQDLKQISLG